MDVNSDITAERSCASTAEQRRLQHIHAAVVDELLEEAEEIRDRQITNVHSRKLHLWDLLPPG